jgi:curved DNA-binding protein CbpA
VEGDDEQMKRINHAWAILGDPRSRAEYDRQRAGLHLGPVQAAPTTTTTTTSATPASAGGPVDRARAEDHAGPPRGEPFGPMLRFGRYEGWTLGQVVRVDRPWLEWLRDVPAGRGLKAEIDAVLQVKRGPGAVDERRHYETNQAKVHTWAPGAPTKVR